MHPHFLTCCRAASAHADSQLEMPTQQLMELIFSDSMFQEAMQVSLTQHALMLVYLSVCLSSCLCEVSASHLMICFLFERYERD